MASLQYLKRCTYSLAFKKSLKTYKLVFQYSFCNPDNKSNILWALLWDNVKELWRCQSPKFLI